MLKKMPFILMTIIIAIISLDPFIPMEIKSIVYGISFSIKSLIVFLLPFIIFSLLFKVASHLAHNGTKVIVLIFAGVCVSNFCSTLVSYSIGSWVYCFDLSLILPQNAVELEPYWAFSLPKLVGNDIAMFAGLISGLITSFLRPKLATKAADILDKGVRKVLSFFAILIPLFVTGFMIKLQCDGVITRIIQDYAFIFVVIALAQFSYIGLIYGIVNNFNIKDFLKSLQNMFPAMIVGFSAMSSAAAMPLTILGAEKKCRGSPFSPLNHSSYCQYSSHW